MINESLGLENRLQNFRKKYFVALFIKGVVLSISILLILFLILSSAEFLSRFNSTVRLTLLLVFILVVIGSFYKLILNPLINLWGIKNTISDEELALYIGNHYPNISDRLLNIIQLNKSVLKTSLVYAAYNQRQNELVNINFDLAIDKRKSNKYILLLGIVVATLSITYLIIPTLFIEGTKRIIYYNKEFVQPSPYNFQIIDFKPFAIKGENYTISFKVNSEYIPKTVTLVLNQNEYILAANKSQTYSYTINNIVKESKFKIRVGSYESIDYNIQIINRPSIIDMEAILKFPKYINKENIRIKNAGNLILPEGTDVVWNIKTNADNLLSFNINNKAVSSKKTNQGTQQFSSRINEQSSYAIQLKHKNYSQITDSISYNINIIKDAHPLIDVLSVEDTSTYKFVDLTGDISDDYGITKLVLEYQIIDKNGSALSKNKKVIAINKNEASQKYYYKWLLDSLKNEGNSIKYYLEVFDNDQINGIKSTKTNEKTIKIPSKADIKTKLEESLDNQVADTKSMKSSNDEKNNSFNEIEKKLKSKDNLNWQDKKDLSNLTKEKQKNVQKIESLQDKLEQLTEQKKELAKPDDEIIQKVDALQELMKDIIDDETKELYKKLEELLKEQNNKNEIDDLIKQLAQKEENFKIELDKMLEMYKDLQIEQKLNDLTEKLNELSKEQLEHSNELKNDKKLSENEKAEAQKKEDDIKQQLEDLKKDIAELNQKNSELKNQKSLPVSKDNINEIGKKQEESKTNIDKNNNKKASDASKEASELSKKLAESIAQSLEKDKKDQTEENAKDLRVILDGLIKISFDQEEIMNGIKTTSNKDPQYITYSQKQLTLKNDSKVISDSLIALSKRVFQMKSFITRELTDMNSKIDESIDAIKSRKRDVILSKQQFSMTAMNNLALMLDDVLKQMQEQMAQQKKEGSKSCSKPGEKPGNKPGNKPGMSEMQKKLNSQLKDMLKNGNKPGKEMSESLAKMAAQQEMIRKALMQIEKARKSKGDKPGGLGDLIKELEKNEEDIVNKRISQDLINRQEKIMTRLLESEKAEEERDQEETRKAEQAKSQEKSKNSKLTDLYLKQKEHEIELLKTLPVNLSDFYKKESQEYIKTIEQ